MTWLDSPFRARERRRHPAPRARGPEHVVRQIAATRIPAPALAVRGHTSLLLACRGAPDTEAASELLRSVRPLDAVQRLQCPVPRWSDVIDLEGEASRWLARRVMQRIDACEPALVAVLLAEGEDDATGQSVVRRLVEWGVTVPVGVLRARPGGGAEWRIVPHAIGLTG